MVRRPWVRSPPTRRGTAWTGGRWPGAPGSAPAARRCTPGQWPAQPVSLRAAVVVCRVVSTPAHRGWPRLSWPAALRWSGWGSRARGAERRRGGHRPGRWRRRAGGVVPGPPSAHRSALQPRSRLLSHHCVVTRPCPGLYEQGFRGALRDPFTGGGIAQDGVHGAPPTDTVSAAPSVSGSMSATSVLSRGSCLICSQCRRASPSPMPSGLQ